MDASALSMTAGCACCCSTPDVLIRPSRRALLLLHPTATTSLGINLAARPADQISSGRDSLLDPWISPLCPEPLRPSSPSAPSQLASSISRPQPARSVPSQPSQCRLHSHPPPTRLGPPRRTRLPPEQLLRQQAPSRPAPPPHRRSTRTSTRPSSPGKNGTGSSIRRRCSSASPCPSLQPTLAGGSLSKVRERFCSPLCCRPGRSLTDDRWTDRPTTPAALPRTLLHEQRSTATLPLASARSSGSAGSDDRTGRLAAAHPLERSATSRERGRGHALNDTSLYQAALSRTHVTHGAGLVVQASSSPGRHVCRSQISSLTKALADAEGAPLL
jgi:hypothetical protein